MGSTRARNVSRSGHLTVLSGVSALLEDQLFHRWIYVQRTVARGQLRAQTEMGRMLSQTAAVGSIGAEVVILPMLSGMSALLGDQVSPRGQGVWVHRVLTVVQYDIFYIPFLNVGSKIYEHF